MTTPTKNAELHVMLDTNALYQDGKGDQFFSARMCKIIGDPKHTKLNIRWVIPRMVQLKYQLRSKAKHLVSIAQDMPAVFASTWVGNEDAVGNAITALAESELRRLNVEVADCDPSLIDWPSLMRAAGLRSPPFDADPEKEKGFKDAVIGETFVQMCGKFPAHGTDTAILVTNDGMLREHVLRQVPRAKVVKTADALANELNILGSDIDPVVASQLPSLAAELLGASSDFWENVGKMATSQFPTPLHMLVDGAGATNVRLLPPVWLPPAFVKKQLKHVYFFCRFQIPRQGQQWMPATQPMSTGLLQMGDPVGPSSRVPTAPGRGLFGSPFGTATFGGGPSPHVLGPATHPLGQYQDVQLPSLTFAINWRADFEQAGTDQVPQLSHPFIESVTLEPM
jgi:hypothetical protein